jgi:hypothetical protein
MACEPSPTCEGAAVDVPDTRVDCLEADIVPGPSGGDVDPLAGPASAPVGADGAPLEAVGMFTRRQVVGQGPGGGVIPDGGCAPVERLRGPRMVERFAAVGERLLLCAQGGAGRSCAFGLPRAVQALGAAGLGRLPGFDARRPMHAGQLPRRPHHAGSWDRRARGLVATGPPLSVRRRRGRPNAVNTRVPTGLASAPRVDERAWQRGRNRRSPPVMVSG